MRALLALLLFLTANSYAFCGQKAYTFGVVPQQSANKLVVTWGPLLKELQRISNIEFVLKIDASIPQFEDKLRKGEYDFAYMNPYHYTTYSKNSGYRAFAKAKDKKIKGIIVVRKDSHITSIEDLANTTLALPSPAAFAASILTRANLAKEGIKFKPVYVNSHDSVYANVTRGLHPAGGGVIRTFRKAAPQYRDELKILWTSKGYTPHAFAAKSTVPPEIVAKLVRAMLKLSDTPKEHRLLKQLGLKGIIKAHDDDWNDVRRLNIDLLK